MNIKCQLPRIIALASLGVISLVLVRGSATAAERVGTYDSRLVAFAAFWDEGHQARLQARMREARAAQDQGDTARHQSLAKELSALQHDLHMQVFSTAPIDEVLAGLKDRLPAVLRETGVSRLVSQWDEAALAGVPAADRVDVTDRLLQEFQMPAARLKHFEQLRSVKPLPLERARLMSQLNQL
jgi:hypothetical protein